MLLASRQDSSQLYLASTSLWVLDYESLSDICLCLERPLWPSESHSPKFRNRTAPARLPPTVDHDQVISIQAVKGVLVTFPDSLIRFFALSYTFWADRKGSGEIAHIFLSTFCFVWGFFFFSRVIISFLYMYIHGCRFLLDTFFKNAYQEPGSGAAHLSS